MDELLKNIFKENGIVDIIKEYKDDIELAELNDKIKMISSQIKTLKTNKKIIGMCVVAENGKPNMKYKDYIKKCGSTIDDEYDQYFHLYVKKLNQLRNVHFELQLEKLLRNKMKIRKNK